MRRPMAALGFSYFFALVIASFVSLNTAVVLAALLSAAFAAGFFIRPIRQNRQAMTALFAAMAAFLMYSAKEMLVCRPLREFDGRRMEISLQTLDWVQQNNSVPVRVVGGGLPKGAKLTLWLSGRDFYPQPYDILTGEFELYLPNDSRSGFARGYSKAAGVFLNARAAGFDEEGVGLATPESRPWMYNILLARRYARNTIMSRPGAGDAEGLMAGIAFGFKEDLGSEIKADFRAVGASHLLAVSGLHAAVLSQAILALLLLLKVPNRAAHLAAAGGVFLFMALTGFQPSIIRAGIMCIVYLFGKILGRQPDSLNSLGLSVFAITAVNPYAVNDVGLLLSFSATFGILVLYPAFKRAFGDRLRQSEKRLPRLLAGPVNSFGLTLSATAPTLPVSLLAFGQISLISPVANLLMVFPASAVTVATIMAVALNAVKPLRFLSAPFFFGARAISDYLIRAARLLSSIPFSSIWAGQTFVIVVIPAAIVLTALGKALLGWRGARVMALWSAIALMCGAISHGAFMKGVTEITVINSGNSAAIVMSRSGYTGVVVSGDKHAVSGAVFELERRNVRAVDFLILPDLSDRSAFYSPEFSKRIGINCLITGHDGEYSDTADALPAAGRLSFENGTLNFWDDCRAELNDGWLIFRIGLTRVLVSPAGGNAAALSENERQANIFVIAGKPPKHIASVEAQAGVLCCAADTYRREIKAIPRVSYPLYNTADKNITFYTRGRGDITVKGGSTVDFD